MNKMLTLLITTALLLLAIRPLAAAPIPVTGIKKQVDGVLLTMNPGRLQFKFARRALSTLCMVPPETLPAQKSFVVVKAWTPFRSHSRATQPP